MRGTLRALLLTFAGLLSLEARAHDLRIPLDELQLGVQRLDRTLQHFRDFPAIPPLPTTPTEQRRVLGAAEIELALGHRQRALEMLMGRLADPAFQRLPEYVETLLFTSQILETSAEDVGAMQYAESALEKGGSPEQMAEAGARWFRLARRHQRMDRRLELYALWRSRGGENVANSDIAAAVSYEVAFALRADGRGKEARELLQRVPSDSAFGSRAAYLASVIFVEEGDLSNAERWFTAIMGWPLPALEPGDPQLQIEQETRQLAALSAGRLRYERGDKDGAHEAYAKIPQGSSHEAEGCWERAFLELDRKMRRGALANVQCVLDLGAAGDRYVSARLFRASLLAHLARYGDSITAYQLLHQDMEAERARFAKAARALGASAEGAAEFLFDGMERSAASHGARATPGPATVFGDAWTAQVDQAYRIDRGVSESLAALDAMAHEVAELTERILAEDAFVLIDVRRSHLERTAREVQHLLGHAGDLQDALAARHASNSHAPDTTIDHNADAQSLREVIHRLGLLQRDVEAQLVDLTRAAEERRSRGLGLLKSVGQEIGELRVELARLEREVVRPVDEVARAAIKEIQRNLDQAAMRAEVGVLDTYWLKKEHRTQAIQLLVDRKKEAEQLADSAIDELDGEPGR